MTVGVIIPTVAKHSRLNEYVPGLLTSLTEAWNHRAKVSRDKCVVLVYVNGLKPASLAAQKCEHSLQRLAGRTLRIKVVANLGNRGFTGSVNDGVEYLAGWEKVDWLAIINDDTKVAPTFWSQILRWARAHHCDAVGCPVLRPDGQVESFGLKYGRTGLAFPVVPTSLTSLSPASILAEKGARLLCGTCLVVKGSVARQTLKTWGYFFNPVFFAYAEDVDLSLRWYHQGVRYGLCADTFVTHFGSRTANRGSAFQLYHGFRNLVLVMILNWLPQRLWMNLPFIMMGQLYALALTWYKGYWLIGPKIVKYLWVHRSALVMMRRRYATQLAHSHSV